MQKTVLLITSAQADLLAENGKAWGFTEASEKLNHIRNNLKTLVEEARRRKIPIIHSPVGFDYVAMKEFSPLNAIQNVIVQHQLLEQGSPGCEFIPESTPTKEEVVLPFRQGFSAFWAGSIQKYLEQLEVGTIYIAGMLAEGCVESHVRDAAENGYKTVVITDAIGSTSLELLEVSMKTLALHSADLIKTEEF